MKERLFKEIRLVVTILLIGLLYYIFVSVAGFGIPCVFNLITGLQCPGCGITRMFVAMAHLDFVSAFRYNPVIFVTLPLLAGCLIYEGFLYIKTGKRQLPLWCNVLLCIEAIVLLIYGVIRNFG